MTEPATSRRGAVSVHRKARRSRAATTNSRRNWFVAHQADLLAIGTLLLLIALVSWNNVWKVDRWVARVDIITFYLPWYAHLGEALRNFSIPGWNPSLFSGTPFAGDPQSGWSYLPAMISFTLFSPIPAMKVFAIMHLLIGGVSTYALARVLGMPAFACLVAGSAFTFGPFMSHNTSCCTIMAQVAPWVPLAMLGTELALRARTRVGQGLAWWVTGLAISQMLGGWIGQGAYNGLIAVGTYLAYRTLISPPRWYATEQHADAPRSRQMVIDRVRTLVVHGAAIYALGFVLGAAGALIRLDVNAATNLAGGAYDEVTDRATRPWDVVGMLGRILSLNSSNLKFYLGGAVFTLMLLGLFVARRRFAVPYFAAYTAVILTLTLHTTPLHRLFYLLPEYQSLHDHSAYRIVGLLWIGPAMLAGATVACWAGRAPRLWTIPLAIAPLIVVLAVRDDLGNGSGTVHDRTVWIVGATCGVLALSAVLMQPRVRERLPAVPITPIASGLLLLLVLWDPTGQRFVTTLDDHGFSSSLEGTLQRLASDTDPNGAGAFLQERTRQDQPFRYFGYDAVGLRTADDDGLTYHGRRLDPEILPLLVSARGLRLGLQDVQGYNPIQLSRYVDVITAINDGIKQDYHDANILPNGVRSSLLDLLNVRYVVIPNDLPPGRPRPDLSYLVGSTREVFRNDEVRVLERTTTLPRAWIVHDAIEVSEDESLELLVSGGIDPRTTALVESEPPSLAEPDDPSTDVATITRYTDDTIRVEARTAADGLLVLSEVFDKGWNAYIDGERVPISVADHVLRAVPLPAGEHTVEMRYEPRSLQVGIVLSSLGLLLGVVLAALAGWQWWTPARRRLV